MATPKLFKAADVCEMVQVQPYVLRSWEKEFPGIGVQKSTDAARLYRQSDIDQVQRIKQLVFGEGLTLAGARRRLEELAPASTRSNDAEVAEVLDALASNARTRIANVRQGLQSILTLLSSAPGTVVLVNDDYQLQPPPPVERTVRSSVERKRPRASAAIPAKAAKKAKRAHA
jgi:DNA-binding transcriptional MerR regulator